MQATIFAGRIVIRHAGQVVADHAICEGRRQRIVDRAYLAGVVGAHGPARTSSPEAEPPPTPALLRPLAEYEAVAGGGW